MPFIRIAFENCSSQESFYQMQQILVIVIYILPKDLFPSSACSAASRLFDNQ